MLDRLLGLEMQVSPVAGMSTCIFLEDVTPFVSGSGICNNLLLDIQALRSTLILTSNNHYLL